jgi:hypothetical protein
MTIFNREVFYRDPTQTKIPNDGVAKVIRPETEQQWEVLQWELRSFVCDGEYERGLDRILSSFLTNLAQPEQPAVWVSGFYGSGKSHFARVLEYLWRDVQMPGGESARSLVTVPDEVRAHLAELSTVGKRLGGLWSAAGTLASGKSDAVRLAFLSVLFESVKLPEEYPLARFMLWAGENGYLEALEAAVEDAGKSLDEEVHDLYVSPIIAKALLDADPSLGDAVKDVRNLLATQFPPTTADVSRTEMLEVMERVLRLRTTTDGKLPLTLVVLDEMQQYIRDDNEKALDIQLLVEDCSARFQNQVLILATGQSALTATPTLQKLTDRFAVQVALSDKDVETVVRQVVLQKRPDRVPEVRATLDDYSGEIDRQLGGTQFAPRAEDKARLVQDYSVLPTRWRLWAAMLRTIDRAGKAGVVRSQLGLIHGGVRSTAHHPLGHVIGTDYLFFDEKTHADMLMSGVLLPEVDDFISRMKDETGDGPLKARLCALIFLISQMPTRTIGGETGLRATPAYLADLLVEDLANDGAALRKRVPELLDVLVKEGRLMRIDDAYQLQTEEGAEWEKDYQSRLAAIRDDAGRISQLRSERLVEAVDSALGNLKLTHGTSKTPRKIEVHWGQDEPAASAGDVPVWVRDEWSVTEAAAKKSAAEAGDESPIVFVFLPKREVEQIKETLASSTAAQETVQQRPVPQTDAGKAAQRAMATRVTTEKERLDGLFQEVVAHPRVFQGGGAEVTTSSLRAAVETAALRSLVRLFPRFAAADDASWGKVVTRARDGAPDALAAVGHQGEPTTNPVCKEVLAATGAGGTKGAELQRDLGAPPFGWPKDAINGAILTLLGSGNIRAAQDGQPVTGPKELPPTQIGKATFYKEDEPPTVPERLAVRGLLTAAAIPYEPGQEGAQIPALLQRLRDLAARSGGPPPLPAPPDTAHLDALLALGGNQQFREVASSQERLAKDLEQWRTADQRREKRETAWRDLERLLRHADGLPVAAEVTPAVAAIRDERQLLDDPDPVAPIVGELADALRKELKRQAERLANEQQNAVAELEQTSEWAQLPAETREALVGEVKLAPAEVPDVSSDGKLLETLDATPLSGWEDRIGLVPSRRDQARQRAAKVLEPESVTVSLPTATIRNEADLKSYVSDLEARVQPHLDAKKTVII